MPELPDVAQFQQYFNDYAVGQSIAGVHVADPRILDATSPQGLGRCLKGRRFTGTGRHGKYLFADVDQGHCWLVLHFGMTGNLAACKGEETRPRFTRAWFDFQNGDYLAYICQRMLGKIGQTDSPDATIRDLDLGPDAMDGNLDLATFRERLKGRRAAVKTVLMNQAVVAGIGNECSDEILFQAAMNPRRRINTLDHDAVRHLYEVMRATLQRLVECRVRGDELPEGFLNKHRSAGAQCPRCGGELQRVAVGGRNGYACPRCQSSDGYDRAASRHSLTSASVV